MGFKGRGVQRTACRAVGAARTARRGRRDSCPACRAGSAQRVSLTGGAPSLAAAVLVRQWLPGGCRQRDNRGEVQLAALEMLRMHTPLLIVRTHAGRVRGMLVPSTTARAGPFSPEGWNLNDMLELLTIQFKAGAQRQNMGCIATAGAPVSKKMAARGACSSRSGGGGPSSSTMHASCSFSSSPAAVLLCGGGGVCLGGRGGGRRRRRRQPRPVQTACCAALRLQRQSGRWCQ